MNTASTRILTTLALAASLAASGCAGMNRSERATATGAAVGGVAGALVTNSPGGAAVGAVIGGVVGHEIEKKK